ncbi:related to bifunctional 4-hydroxyphenylacetate degradation enzyme [Fusarium oxysporum]|uniref:Related to bifunctional 4-hydroxyphenylacetate degradation enzyme n=1 Tax=Fusarium oxysporum TaxID=5507 RepID=A0A2H3SNP0_FUSOX|nr:related to bifunctional 4-hydroxyphenylacetate degradation enzyme [Fusarium oxysporum]
MGSQSTSNIMQYATYVQPNTGLPRVGHFDLANGTIQPLSFISGTPVADLYQVIAAGASRIIPDGEALAAKDVKLLPTISGRDIMAVGKNYMEHAKEFNSSGYDSSDKTDRPSHPVIFTKRATSIIAHGDVILPHAEFSQTLDYEGEIGVVVGKTGYRVSEADAWDYVWGYTIINDMTARERQRDHKQFFIGKSADTFCPIGPVAVSKDDLPSVLKVETHVNGELRQSSTTQDLIFSIPTLIKTISEGQTLQPGDVIATGTPAGVGIGKNPPVFLQPGDEVSVSVTGLGTLTNKIGTAEILNSTVQRVSSSSPFQITNSAKTLGAGVGLAELNGKQLNYQRKGSGSDHIVFVHGLGGTLDYWTPLISKLSLAENKSLHLFDLEGHGLSPTHPLSKLSIESFALDIRSIFDAANITSSAPATLFAHSLGCLAALNFALDNPSLVDKLVLVGPPPSPLLDAASKGAYARAAIVRSMGMRAVADAVVDAGTSGHSKQMNPTAIAAVRLSLLGQDPESYAKATWALAGATQELKVEQIQAKTLIITGDEDKVSPPSLCEKYASRIQDAQVVVLNNVGHWHVFEDVGGVAQAVDKFL